MDNNTQPPKVDQEKLAELVKIMKRLYELEEIRFQKLRSKQQ